MRMKRIAAAVLGAGLLFAAPAFAQNAGSFSDLLKGQLGNEQATSGFSVSDASDTAIGSAEQLPPPRLDPVGTGAPYDAGRDETSGMIAVGAALLAALAVLLMLALVFVSGSGRRDSDG
jgi:hypothetical protein